MNDIQSIVIVGAGQAGAMAAAALRGLGYGGRLTLVGDEAHPPYERPPLSKQALQAETPQPAAVHPASYYAEQGIELLTGTPARELDLAERTVQLGDGRRLRYDRCLLATGGRARELPALPRGMPGVHYVRTLDDALALRGALARDARVAVIGGGFLGLEIASTARDLGAAVSVLETAPRVLERALPQPLSDWLAARVRQAGIDLRLGCRVREISPGTPHAIALQDGTALQAELAVVAIGLTPDVALAQAAGLAIDGNGGIRVDAHARTSDPYVYAAGDCASQPRDGLDGPMRFESWQNANEQARTAAAAMLGQAPGAQPVPWFWTDQYGCNIQMLGLPRPGLHYVCRGQSGDGQPKLLWLGLHDGVPRHGIAVNAGGDLRQLRVLFERGLALDPDRFSDETQPLKALVKACQAAAAS